MDAAGQTPPLKKPFSYTQYHWLIWGPVTEMWLITAKRRKCKTVLLYLILVSTPTKVSTKEKGLKGQIRFKNAHAFPSLPWTTLILIFLCLWVGVLCLCDKTEVQWENFLLCRQVFNHARHMHDLNSPFLACCATESLAAKGVTTSALSNTCAYCMRTCLDKNV